MVTILIIIAALILWQLWANAANKNAKQLDERCRQSLLDDSERHSIEWNLLTSEQKNKSTTAWLKSIGQK